MKATMSSDGLPRGTVNVRYWIDIDELAIIAAHLINQTKKRKITKRQVEEELRYRLEANGKNGIYELEKFGCDNGWADLKARARDLVVRLYPGFDVASRK